MNEDKTPNSLKAMLRRVTWRDAGASALVVLLVAEGPLTPAARIPSILAGVVAGAPGAAAHRRRRQVRARARLARRERERAVRARQRHAHVAVAVRRAAAGVLQFHNKILVSATRR